MLYEVPAKYNASSLNNVCKYELHFHGADEMAQWVKVLWWFKENGPKGSGISGKCGLVGVGVGLLEEVSNYVGRL